MIKISRLRLLGFLLFHIHGAGMEVLLNPMELLVKELFFNKILALKPANAIKTKFLQKVFNDFVCFLGTANLRNISFLFIG